MKLQVNGETRDIQQATNVASLLKELGLSDTPAAVEVNRKLVPKREHANTPLNEGDTVEVVTLVGGG